MTENNNVWPNCYQCKSYEEIAKYYLQAYEWIMTIQNRDGSIGRSWIEKAILTPHCVQLFAQSGLPRNNFRYENAINWLKTEFSHEKRPHWYGRIPALISAGEKDWLVANNDISIFLDDLEKSKIEDFFWFVLPTLISLKKVGIKAPYEEAVTDLMKYRKDFNTGNISFSNKPNYTGLAMLYLKELDPKKYESEINRMMSWILEDHRREENGVTHWDNSIGVTSYVLIDFAELGISNKTEIYPFIDTSLLFLKPTSDGSLPEDRFASTYGTTIHEGKFYTTLLATRAMASLLGQQNCVMTTSTAISVHNHTHQSVRKMVSRSIRRYQNFIIWSIFITLIIAFLIILLGWLGLERLIEEIGLVIIGAILGFFIVKGIETFLGKRR